VTLADRIEAVILEQGPAPECHLATALRKRRDEVTLALRGNPDRFVHNGLKARASRWDVRREVVNGVSHFADPAAVFPPNFDKGEEALVTLIRLGLRTPEDALVLVVCAVNGAVA
jgi:hypothetical protein